MRHGAKNVSPALLPLHFFRAATWQSLPSNASRDLAPPRPRRLWRYSPTLKLAALDAVGTRCDANAKVAQAASRRGWTRRPLVAPPVPSASSVEHAHITQRRAAHAATASRHSRAAHSPGRRETQRTHRAARPSLPPRRRSRRPGLRLVFPRAASPPNCLKSAGRMRSTNGASRRSRAPRPSRILAEACIPLVLRIAALWSHGPLLPTHFVIDCWQRPRTHARSFVWTCHARAQL